MKKKRKKGKVKKKEKKKWERITVDYCCNPQGNVCGGTVIPPHHLDYVLIYIYIYIYSIGLIKYSCYSDDSVDSSLIFSKPEYQNIKNFYFEYFLWKQYIFF